MSKARLLFGLSAIASVLAIAASPAAAKFVTNNGTTKGPLQLKGVANFGLETAGGEKQVEVSCGELTKGEWRIQTATKQEGALEGDHLNLSGQFTKCKETIAGVTAGATVNSACVLQVEQHPGQTPEFTGGVAAGCVIAQKNGCEIKVAAEAANTGLSKVVATNVEAKNTELKSSVTGFNAVTNETCKKLGVNATTGLFEATAIAHEVKVV